MRVPKTIRNNLIPIGNGCNKFGVVGASQSVIFVVSHNLYIKVQITLFVNHYITIKIKTSFFFGT